MIWRAHPRVPVSPAGSPFPSRRGLVQSITPTGLSTADSDGGCDGQAASDVNAGRFGGADIPVKPANVAIFPPFHG